jgi:hypothetical protein
MPIDSGAKSLSRYSGIERTGSRSIVNDVSPDLQRPEPTNEVFVDGTVSKCGQVVDVPPERRSVVSSKLLRARFRLGDDR